MDEKQHTPPPSDPPPESVPAITENAEDDSDSATEQYFPKVCPNCMTPNPESADNCRTCFTPLSYLSTVDPLMSIAARGDTFTKASSKPQKPIIFLGMWLIFGPIAIIFGTIFIGSVISLLVYPTLGGLFVVLLIGFFFFLPAGILLKTTNNFFRTPPTEPSGFPLVEDQQTEESDTEWKGPEEGPKS